MSENLREVIKELTRVSEILCPQAQKLELIHISKNPKIFRALREISVNIIKGNITMDEETRNKLLIHKDVINNIYYSSETCAKDRRKLVVQSGGWLWILPLVTSIIDLIK